MTIRTTSKTITFNRPFCLKGVDRWLPPGDYRVVTDEELIEGLSFPAYHRISTVIFVPAQSGSAVERVSHEALRDLAERVHFESTDEKVFEAYRAGRCSDSRSNRVVNSPDVLSHIVGNFLRLLESCTRSKIETD